MFKYFADNYVWSLSVNISLGTGGQMTEIDRACRPLVDFPGHGDDVGTEHFLASWSEMADGLIEYAEKDATAGREMSAAARYARASMYYLIAERMQARDYAPRKVAYQKAMDTFAQAIQRGGENCERVEIPYDSAAFPGLFVRAEGVDRPAPTMVFCQGLDSMKEMVYRSGMANALARQGISTLIVDQPGTGEALRYRELPGCYDSERWASAAVDYLQTRGDVDGSRLGMMGWSLGGYFAPRAAAFEKRFSLCAVWSANYNWGELQKRRLAREGDRPVPHYWDHVQWVFGKSSLQEFMDWVPAMSLEGVVDKITVPFLVTHGETDTQIPIEYAHAQYEGAVNAPVRELKIFTADEGGSAHCGADNMTVPMNYLADWIAAHL
ncbi:alpha/beta hydrolase family protein [Mycobacterium lentiflavum]|uniref:Alpha/beta hydrolase n=1 Tax=Mycobacterium lentiflavum TaxID=141349 RepID=A0ABY3USM3_MYCLN|nr:alpha/beta fold hydrolase [Mycobacterium lentiflavum]ULP41604.1 alpha/beta hydrolase [Mycobacterium lentiflavum]